MRLKFDGEIIPGQVLSSFVAGDCLELVDTRQRKAIGSLYMKLQREGAMVFLEAGVLRENVPDTEKFILRSDVHLSVKKSDV